MLPHQVDQRIVLQISRRGKQQVRRSVDRPIVLVDHLPVEALDGFARAQNRLAQGMVLPEVGGEDFVDQGVGAVRVHLDLFQNDALFLVDILIAEERMEHQVGQHVESPRQMLVEHLGVETDQLLGGEGVQVAADGVHRARDIFGGAVGSALEQHVLDEVRNAVLVGSLTARTGADPYSYGDGADMRHDLADDAHAISKRGHFDIAHGRGGNYHVKSGRLLLYSGYNVAGRGGETGEAGARVTV